MYAVSGSLPRMAGRGIVDIQPMDSCDFEVSEDGRFVVPSGNGTRLQFESSCACREDAAARHDTLGAGTNGYVQQIEHEGRPVAVKRLYVFDAGDAEGKFLLSAETLRAEARILKLMREKLGSAYGTQRHLVECLGTGTAKVAGSILEPCILLECVSGPRNLLAEQDIGPADRWRLTKELLVATATLEELGIVHQDISLSNVVLRESGALVLLDFGEAVLTDDLIDGDVVALTGKGAVTFHAPEYDAVDRAFVGPRSDVFSAGLVTAALWAGHKEVLKPYEDYAALSLVKRDRQACERAIAEIIDAATSAVRGRDGEIVAEQVGQLLLRMLTYAPADRVLASEMLRVLER